MGLIIINATTGIDTHEIYPTYGCDEIKDLKHALVTKNHQAWK